MSKLMVSECDCKSVLPYEINKNRSLSPWNTALYNILYQCVLSALSDKNTSRYGTRIKVKRLIAAQKNIKYSTVDIYCSAPFLYFTFS